MPAARRRPVHVIWSACHTGQPQEDYLHTVIDQAAAAGVQGVELSGGAIDRYLDPRRCPLLAEPRDPAEQQADQGLLERVSRHAADRGLRFGIWHHEIHGPAALLDRIPELKAADGLIDLDSPLLYRLIRDRMAAFVAQYPCVDELVLTMTETRFPVFRRPFCAIPVPERVRRLLEALLAALEPQGKRLVIRPFSAIREDELHVREAVEQLRSKAVSMMYKTEPFDWHPFLPDEPLIGSLPNVEARAETDAGAEYYGQAVFPCSYTRFLDRRLAAALDRGATVAVIRVDRGAGHPSLGHPINEANILVPTRRLQAPEIPLETLWSDWFRERHAAAPPPGLLPLLEQTFEVIQKTLYIDRQAFTHNLFPSFVRAKHVQAFGLFEENVPLDHMRRNWGILADRRTLTHEALLAEKEEALRLAQEIVAAFDSRGAGLPEAARAALRDSLARLPLLAESCLAFCRTCAAHFEEMENRTPRTTAGFEAEADRLRALADRIERNHGPDFWGSMPVRMRGVADGLAAERAMEQPLRQALAEEPDRVDAVLCGFASEGHRLGKMLHSGRTFVVLNRCVRETGIGEEQGIQYRLARLPGRPHRLTLTLAGDGLPRPGNIQIGDATHAFQDGGEAGLSTHRFDVPAAPEPDLIVRLWSTSAAPCRVAQIQIDRVG